MMLIMNMMEFARIIDRLIRNRLINYWFCHFSAAAMLSIDTFSMMLIMNMVEFASRAGGYGCRSGAAAVAVGTASITAVAISAQAGAHQHPTAAALCLRFPGLTDRFTGWLLIFLLFL